MARILGEDIASLATYAIGVSEVLMGIWILSKLKIRFCVLSQIILVTVMNTLEFVLAPDLLLFGKINALVALLFIIMVYLNGFKINTPK